MIRGEVTTAVKAILTKIREAKGGEIITFDFTGGSPFVASRAIQHTLVEKGYVVYIVLGGGDSTTERMYIDLGRRRQPPQPDQEAK